MYNSPIAKILVVDDEDDMSTLIRMLLEKDGHRVSTAFDGEEALNVLGVNLPDAEAALPDLVVLDVMMPKINGYEVSQRMADYPPTGRIPVIILTAKGRLRESFVHSPNVKIFLEKPFSQVTMREAVAKALNPFEEVKIYERSSQFGWAGDNGWGEKMIQLVLGRSKTATAGPKALYTPEQLQDILSMQGQKVTVLDKDQRPRCAILVKDVFETTFGAPDPRLLEGCGFKGRIESFKTAHFALWSEFLFKNGIALDNNTILIAQLFELTG